jgi:hypothetical protein
VKCVGTVFAIKVKCPQNPTTIIDGTIILLTAHLVFLVQNAQDLSEYRHPPAKIAGVLEHVLSMLRPSCPENLPIYNDLESYMSVVINQMLALVPTASGNGSSSMLM